MTTFRNVHVRPETPALPPDRVMPRLRVVTNDPAREYAQRLGEVEKLPDSVAALILWKQEFRKVGRNGIAIEFEGRKYRYWSEHSVTIATKAGTDEKVLCTFNRQQPDVLHILTRDGEYVESIPQDGKAQWFNPEQTQREIGAKKRANQRRMDRIAELHAPDSEAALERETQNEAQLKSALHTFPAAGGCGHRNSTEDVQARARVDRRDRIEGPELGCVPERNALGRPEIRATRPQSSSAGSFSKAARLHEVQRSLGVQRAAFEAQEATRAQRVADVTEADLDDLIGSDDATFSTSSPDLEVGAALTATREPAEEDASDWIL